MARPSARDVQCEIQREQASWAEVRDFGALLGFLFRRRQWRWFGFEDCRRQWFLIRQPFEYLLGFECSLDEIDKCVGEKWLFNFCHHVGQTRRRGIHFQNVPGHQQHRPVRDLLVF